MCQDSVDLNTPSSSGLVSENWERFAKDFEFDGSLRDIYVFDTSLDDWNELFRFLIRQRYTFEFSGAWSGDDFPSDLARLFRSGPDCPATLMSIQFSGLRLNCHFFEVHEIEFDIDPREVTDATGLADLIAFMGGLADAPGKSVVLTLRYVRPRHRRRLRGRRVPRGGSSA